MTMFRGASAALLALALVPLADPAHGQDAERVPPHLGLPTYPLKADDQFRWTIPIKLVNASPAGLYTDSLRIEIEDLDAGATRRPRRYALTDTTISRFLPSISVRDSGIFRYAGSAFSETARIGLRLYSHGGDGTRYESTGELSIGPGIMSEALPSRFLKAGKDTIEYVLVPEVWPPKASPALLIINGWDGHARLLLPTAWHLANHGYTVMVVSLPGYGLSSGPADLGGARSLAAVERALDRLRRSEGVDSTRIALWGISQGAITALQVAARHRDLKAVVAQSGLYDLDAVERTTTSDEMHRLLAEEAGPRGSWKHRSPLAAAKRIKVPVMLLHGEADQAAPVAQANDFITELKAAGLNVNLRLLPKQGNRLNPIAVRDAADEFFTPYLGPIRKGRQ